MGFIALCAEDEILRSPELLGLEGERFDRLRWLRTYSKAEEARRMLARSSDVDEVWVVSSDAVDPINLAAALKVDVPTRAVYLVSASQSGSLRSRAHSAGIDGVLGRVEFVGKYLQRKQKAQEGAHAVRPAHARAEDAGADSVPRHAQAEAPRISLEDQAKAIVRDDLDTTGFRGPVSKRKRAGQGAGVPGSNPYPPGNDEAVEGSGLARREGGAAQVVKPDEGATTALATTAPKEPAFLLPVVSGSGGSGKSAVAAMASLITQQAGLKTILIDLDLQFGDMKETLGLEDALHVEDLVEAPIRLRHLSSEDGLPALLTIPRNLEQSEEVIKQLPALLDLVSASYDVVVVNTGSFWADEQVVLLERCSRALFLVDQRPSSLRACQRALDLCTRCGIATSPLIFAVNKCCKNGMYSSIDVSCALHGASAKELMWGGAAVEEYLAAGQAQALLETRNAFVSSLGALLSEIVPAMPEVEVGRSSQGRSSLLRLFGIE